jgi:hypothetical protein
MNWRRCMRHACIIAICQHSLVFNYLKRQMQSEQSMEFLLNKEDKEVKRLG